MSVLVCVDSREGEFPYKSGTVSSPVSMRFYCR